MRFQILSNAPFAHTGYGNQVRLLAERLLADGHDVSVAANYGLAGTVITWNGIPILPQGDDRYSNDISPAHYVAWSRDEPAWLITLYDVWPLAPRSFDMIPNLVSWVPIDHFPAQADVVGWFPATGAIPLAMSRYGEAQLRLAGLPDVHYIPHAIDTTIFAPGQTMADGRTARQYWGFPDDAFVVGIYGANKGNQPPRKAWPEMFRALGPFMAAHPDVFVYCHTERTGSQNGVDLELLVKASGIPPERIKFADRYAYAIGAVGDRDLAAMMGATDVQLQTSYGEGFGLTALEAAACGTPSIVNSFSAQPEILGFVATDTNHLRFEHGPDAVGWLVDGQPWWDPHHNADFQIPYIGSIIEALEAAYAARGDQALRDRARARALAYDVDRVYAEMWRPLLAELEPRTRKMDLKPPSRAERRAAKGRKR